MTGWTTREADVLVRLQRGPGGHPVVLSTARGLSHVGEHAAGWLALAGTGWLFDRRRRRGWAVVGAAAFCSHAASVLIKRIVRRPRPHDERIRIGVGTPSSLSFPSSHAASTTATMLTVSWLLGRRAPLALVPAMMLSRMILGVHYPTDVAAGAVLGAATAGAFVQHERRAERAGADPGLGPAGCGSRREAEK